MTDTFRLGWDALAWNSRKSLYRLRGRRDRCPCQVASDSGRAGETGCEAILGYRSPARFRTVCPLLTRRDAGWICSADARDVRPFWGRAGALLGSAALIGALVVSLLVFALLRGIGYQIAYTQIVWPPAWSEFRRVQAEYYLARAGSAFANDDLGEAILHLGNAYELNPADYRSGLLLARLWQAGEPALADRTYARLFDAHPEHRAEIARAWYEALLPRSDFRSIQRLAGERLLNSGPAPSVAWLQAFLFATRQLGESAGLDRLLDAPGRPDSIVALLKLERDLPGLDSAARAERLANAATATRDAFTACHLLQRLLAEGRADLVLRLCTTPSSPLADREKARLGLDAFAAMDRSTERTALVRRLLAPPLRPEVCEVLSSHLITHPDAAFLAEYAAKFTREPLPPGEKSYEQTLAFFAVCGVHQDSTLIAAAAAQVKSAAGGGSFRTLDAVREAFLQTSPPIPPGRFLPLLQPLPLEVTYALLTRFSPPPPYPR